MKPINMRRTRLVGIIFLLLFCGACSKSGFLDKHPNSDNVIPSTYADFQALLDNTAVMGVTPVLGELSADNYMIFDYGFWLSLDAKERNAYFWNDTIYNGQGSIADWNLPYQQVFYANVVLDGLSGMKKDSAAGNADWKRIKGSALFLRAYAFYNLVSVFAAAYDNATAGTDMGIPIRLHSEVATQSTRASVAASYEQILADLHGARALLTGDIYKDSLNRPSRPAVLAMLARVYLSMRIYDQAGLYADSCLKVRSTLQNYSDLMTIGNNIPFSSPALNPEIIYHSVFVPATPQVLQGVFYPKVVVDSNLYNAYDTSDLRRKIFYRINGSGYPNIKGGYGGSLVPFTGLATDEVWLIRAECRARAGQFSDAWSDLYYLLTNRWIPGNVAGITRPNDGVLLDSIQVNRRKELAFRGIRWTDMKRLNKEGRNITATRVLNGMTYQLLPNSYKYVLPIPPDVIALNPLTVLQNPGRY